MWEAEPGAREECTDPSANSPYIAEPIWITSAWSLESKAACRLHEGIASAADQVENFTAVASIIDYNISVTFDWDASWGKAGGEGGVLRLRRRMIVSSQAPLNVNEYLV